MENIALDCPKCGQELAVEPAMQGEAFPCPNCGESISIPAPPAPVQQRMKKVVFKKSSVGRPPLSLSSTPSSISSVEKTPTAPDNVASSKSRLVAIIFCFILGLFGFHRFYAGRVATGMVQLAIWLGVLTLVVLALIAKVIPMNIQIKVVCCLALLGAAIWWLIDLVMVIVGTFRDKGSRHMRDW